MPRLKQNNPRHLKQSNTLEMYDETCKSYDVYKPENLSEKLNETESLLKNQKNARHNNVVRKKKKETKLSSINQESDGKFKVLTNEKYNPFNLKESCSSMPNGRFLLVDTLSPINCFLHFNFINKVMWTSLNNFYQQRFLQNMKKILSSTHENKKQLQQQYMFFDAYKPKEVNLKSEESTTKSSELSLSPKKHFDSISECQKLSLITSSYGKLPKVNARNRGYASHNLEITEEEAEIIKNQIKEQVRGKDPDNLYIECPLCNKKIKRLYHFHRHMRIHLGKKNHKCPHCEYKSVRKDNLKSHMKIHYKNKKEVKFENFEKVGEIPTSLRHQFESEISSQTYVPNQQINGPFLSRTTTNRNDDAFKYQSKGLYSLSDGSRRNQYTLDPFVTTFNFLPRNKQTFFETNTM